MFKKITLLKDRVEDWAAYPFSVPTIASLTEIEIDSRGEWDWEVYAA
ncbi:MAG TPA: hypothetical protein VIX90_00700 [Edaphobacter sp.]